MMEISEKVLTAAGLRPSDDAEPATPAEAFTPADDEPIEID
jgi:hypothetical protein